MNDEEKFLAYEYVRESGVTNMFNISLVSELSGLSKDEVIYVMEHYTELKNKYKKED